MDIATDYCMLLIMSTQLLKDLMYGLWLGLSVLAILVGVASIFAVPNPFPLIILGLIGAAFFLGFLEKERR